MPSSITRNDIVNAAQQVGSFEWRAQHGQLTQLNLQVAVLSILDYFLSQQLQH